MTSMLDHNHINTRTEHIPCELRVFIGARGKAWRNGQRCPSRAMPHFLAAKSLANLVGFVTLFCGSLGKSLEVFDEVSHRVNAGRAG